MVRAGRHLPSEKKKDIELFLALSLAFHATFLNHLSGKTKGIFRDIQDHDLLLLCLNLAESVDNNKEGLKLSGSSVKALVLG